MSPRSRTSRPGLGRRRAALLEAHVRFELERWSGPGLSASLREEVEVLYAWLASVRLEEIAPAQTAAPVMARLVEQVPVTEAAATALAETVTAVVRAAADRDLRVRDMVQREDVFAFADTASGLDRLRAEVIGALTASSAYRHLVAHVLYQGVKDYVLTENVFARRIPGASSLVRFGQRGINTAVPGLEQAVDKQLSAFVEANIGETLRDSRRYLEATIDAEMVRSLVAEAWTALAPRRVAEIGELADEDDIATLSRDLVALIRDALGSGRLTPVVESTVRDLLDRRATESPADLLREVGMGEDEVVAAVTAIAAPLMERPAVRRHVESRIRARLAAFYADEQCPVDD